jgi:hypothetical protein
LAKRQVSRKEAIQVAEEHNMIYLETSAQNDINIKELVRLMILRVLTVD